MCKVSLIRSWHRIQYLNKYAKRDIHKMFLLVCFVRNYIAIYLSIMYLHSPSQSLTPPPTHVNLCISTNLNLSIEIWELLRYTKTFIKWMKDEKAHTKLYNVMQIIVHMCVCVLCILICWKIWSLWALFYAQ